MSCLWASNSHLIGHCVKQEAGWSGPTGYKARVTGPACDALAEGTHTKTATLFSPPLVFKTSLIDFRQIS